MFAWRKLRKGFLPNLYFLHSQASRNTSLLCRESSSFPHPRRLPHSPPAFAHQSLWHGLSGRAFSSSADSAPRLPSNVAKAIGNLLLVVGCGVATYYCFPHPPSQKKHTGDDDEEEHVVINWSGTHQAKTSIYIQPESLEELEIAVKLAHEKKQKLRPVGSGLSPNGMGLCDDGMVNLALMDKILDIDMNTKRVTVQAGARVEQVVEALRPHGLTLQNFASIKQQQIGGYTQVGAHGSGANIPPVDEQVVSLKLVTPAKGTIELSDETEPDLFYLARCSLGTLGVVAELTLQCVPMHKLLEHTFVATKKEVRKKHRNWLQENQHLRYMWIPDTDSVVVVKCNPLPEGKQPPAFKSKYPEEERTKPAQYLYKQCALKYRAAKEGKSSNESEALGEKAEKSASNGSSVDDDSACSLPELLSDEKLKQLSFTELRDKLLAMDPLNREHVIQVNQVEAEYWKRCEGFRVGWSDEILGFDCGGQQWVSEVCFPVGSYKKPNGNDITYMEKLLELIKKNRIPAPAPIEQRWTAGSRSPLSLAHSPRPDDLFSWVGIIMYLPTDDLDQRKAITTEFSKYCRATQMELWDVYSAYEHWAKLEVDFDDKEWLHKRLQKHFPIDKLNKARQELDPNAILSNHIINELLPLSMETTT